MAEKQIAWASGEGYITIIFGGDGNGSVSVSSDENVSYDAREQAVVIRTTTGSPEQTQTLLIKQEGKRLAAGTTFKFDYTGAVQSVDLPAGRYKLQCWGAQGGDVTGTYAVAGSKGGYSEGVLVLTEPKTLYIFVGGKGTDYTSSDLQNDTTLLKGGWNGGGDGFKTAYSANSITHGRSFPRGGGGATDIALISSESNRSSESLLSRFIVAGGGAGASARYTINYATLSQKATYKGTTNSYDSNLGMYYSLHTYKSPISGRKYTLQTGDSGHFLEVYALIGGSAYGDRIGTGWGSVTVTAPANTRAIDLYINTSTQESYTAYLTEQTPQTTTYSIGIEQQQGGGVTGKGQYSGTQSASGLNGSFGVGANAQKQFTRYSGGGGGGGWYGGGSGYSDASYEYINYSGGGSGFVNTAANASYRPSGYTGLELESGNTIAGDQSFPSTDGGTETGHSGNGCAIITVL